MSDKPDVIVVGGGVIGLSCAWRLRQRGLRVTLLEWRTCGSGASAASLGVLMPAPATRRGPLQRLQRQSLADYPAFAAELAERSGLAIGYRRCGLLEVLPGDGRRQQAIGEARIACADWPAVGGEANMAVLSEAEARSVAAEVAFQPFGARLCRVTANVDVLRLIDSLRAACLADGVVLREACAVKAVAAGEGGWRGVTLGEGRIEAGAVLVCAGAWTSQLGAPLERFAAIRPVRGQALLLRAPKVHLPRIIKQRTVYLVPGPDGTIMLGATTEPESGFNARPTASGIAELTAAGLALVPALADAEVMRTWAGLRPEPVGGHLLLGAVPEADGLFVAAGHYKIGVGLAPLTGRLMAERIVDGAASVDLTPFAPDAGSV